MTIRIGLHGKRGEVECDFCAKVKELPPDGIDTLTDVVEGEFIRVSLDEEYARHACIKCIREGRATLTGNREPEQATAIFDALSKAIQTEYAEHFDFMKDIADTAIENLPDANFDDEPAEDKKPSGQLLARTTPAGSEVVVTGPFKRGKREEVEDLLQRAGYHPRNTVTNRTKAVILGSRALAGFTSGKLRSANKKGIPVIGEEAFFAANVENKQVPPPPISDGMKAKLEAQRRHEERQMLQRRLAEEERLKRIRAADVKVAEDHLREVLKEEVSFEI